MYKIKLFRNMSGLVAGNSFKQMVTNRDWWKGVFGNMVSTMLGIALTVGVGALVEHHNDKRLSREMMFNVVKTAHDNVHDMEVMQSANNIQLKAANALIFASLDKKLNKMPEDSIIHTLINLYYSTRYTIARSETEKYFYSAQMMHQFKNPEKYVRFAEFVSFDKRAYDDLLKMQTVSEEMERMVRNEIIYKNSDPVKLVEKMIADNTLGTYFTTLYNIRIEDHIKSYKRYYLNLLKIMGATEEEFQEYVKENVVPEDSIK